MAWHEGMAHACRCTWCWWCVAVCKLLAVLHVAWCTGAARRIRCVVVYRLLAELGSGARDARRIVLTVCSACGAGYRY